MKYTITLEDNDALALHPLIHSPFPLDHLLTVEARHAVSISQSSST